VTSEGSQGLTLTNLRR